MPTSRLGLPTPTGTSLISTGDNDISALAGILDAAAMYAQGTFASRPAASALNGKFYLATDVSILYLSDGTTWHEVSRGGGSVPIGGMVDYAGAADPADTRYMLCDGRAISRTTYAALFALAGTTYGSGDGSTTFNIPDYRGRTSVGPDNMGTGQGGAGRMAANNTRGAVGGSETKTLVEANLPAHTHGVGTLATSSAGAHDHTQGTLATDSQGAHTHGVGTYGVNNAAAFATGDDTPDHGHAGNTGGVSAGHTHETADLDWVSLNMDVQGDPLSIVITPGQGGTPYLYSTAGQSNDHYHGFTTAGAGSRHQHLVPIHGHGFSGSSASAGAHTHTVTGTVASAGAHSHTITGATASTGSGTAFNGMPPYVVANKIIRVA